MENMAKGGRTTGTQDVHYNLISVLYHTLQGAETSTQYMTDAEESGDEELKRFFQEVQDEYRRRAEQAKELLGRRLSQGSHR